MSKARTIQEKAAEARAEIDRREDDIAGLDGQAAGAQAEFEDDPTPEKHGAMVVAGQLLKNARASLDAYRAEAQPLLDAERLEQDKARMHELLSSLTFEQDAKAVTDRVTAAFSELAASLGGVFALQEAADAHNRVQREVASLAVRTGETVDVPTASFSLAFDRLATRLGRFGHLLDGGVATRKGVQLRLVNNDPNLPPFAELTLRVPSC
jgi:hypothetical protein